MKCICGNESMKKIHVDRRHSDSACWCPECERLATTVVHYTDIAPIWLVPAVTVEKELRNRKPLVDEYYI